MSRPFAKKTPSSAPYRRLNLGVPGTRFGQWVVKFEIEPRNRCRRCLCLCDCGRRKAIFLTSLTSGSSRSCGCVSRFAAYVARGKKRCSKCREVLTLDQFYRRRDRTKGQGVRNCCMPCALEMRKLARDRATPEAKERALATARQWKGDNKERNTATKRAWEARNPSKVSTYSRRTSAKWRAANQRLGIQRSLASRAKKPEAYKAYNQRWSKENAPRCRASYKRYMARKRHAMPKWADDRRIQRFYDRCTERNRLQTSGHSWHVDHIVPLQSPFVCGLHTQDNLRVVTSRSNLSKGNRRWLDMWPQENLAVA